MSPLRPIATWLLVVGLLSMAMPARAADFDKYLLDDADGVFTFNVKQVAASPLYTKNFQKQVEGLLQTEPAATLLKGTGFDPLKDVERITVVIARSSYGPEGQLKPGTMPSGGAPFVILQGNLDAAMLKVLADQLGKTVPVKITEQKAGNASYWEITAGKNASYLAVPEKGIVLFCGVKDQMTDALDKAAGKKKTKLKSQALQDMLAKLDPKASAGWAATGDMISGTKMSTFGTVGQKIGDKEIEVKGPTVEHMRLSQEGITAVTGSLTVSDEIKGQMTLTCKDADKAKELAKNTQDGLANGGKLLASERALAPLAEALKSVKVKAQDKTLNLEGQAKAEAIDAVVKWFLLDKPAPKSR